MARAVGPKYTRGAVKKQMLSSFKDATKERLQPFHGMIYAAVAAWEEDEVEEDQIKAKIEEADETAKVEAGQDEVCTKPAI